MIRSCWRMLFVAVVGVPTGDALAKPSEMPPAPLVEMNEAPTLPGSGPIVNAPEFSWGTATSSRTPRRFSRSSGQGSGLGVCVGIESACPAFGLVWEVKDQSLGLRLGLSGFLTPFAAVKAYASDKMYLYGAYSYGRGFLDIFGAGVGWEIALRPLPILIQPQLGYNLALLGSWPGISLAVVYKPR